MSAAVEGVPGMDQLPTLLQSWAPFLVLMAIWFFLIRRPLMRRLTDWFRSREQ
jgi:preprotein translocase subunit YajC